MPRHYTKNARINLNATTADEPFLILVEIHHQSFSEPARIVADTQDITHAGYRYTALPIDVTLPDEGEGKLPQAKLIVDNVGRVLTDEIDGTRGFEGGTCVIMQVMRSNPSHVEWGIELDVLDVSIDQLKISATLGYEDMLNKPAVTMRFTPERSPGLF
ncbi:DUF1833 domain-containing protein [Photobacterium frigidiphilum]|uniref:DUF1833 family protein n=1 Tax=Photobacterium frigidiphilum TaxID=264736 RepID=UPI003D0F81A8